MTLHVKYKIMAYSLEYCFSSLQPMYNFGHRQWDLNFYKIELVQWWFLQWWFLPFVIVFLFLVIKKIHIQWNLCNLTPEFSDILWHPKKNYGPKVFLLIKIKPEYSDILYNPTHFFCPLVCRIRQVPRYIYIFLFSILQNILELWTSRALAH